MQVSEQQTAQRLKELKDKFLDLFEQKAIFHIGTVDTGSITRDNNGNITAATATFGATKGYPLTIPYGVDLTEGSQIEAKLRYNRTAQPEYEFQRVLQTRGYQPSGNLTPSAIPTPSIIGYSSNIIDSNISGTNSGHFAEVNLFFRLMDSNGKDINPSAYHITSFLVEYRNTGTSGNAQNNPNQRWGNHPTVVINNPNTGFGPTGGDTIDPNGYTYYTFTLTNQPTGTALDFRVSSVTSDTNVFSPPSNIYTLITATDPFPPKAPNFSAPTIVYSPSLLHLTLSWPPNTENDIDHYNVYVGPFQTSGAPTYSVTTQNADYRVFKFHGSNGCVIILQSPDLAGGTPGSGKNWAAFYVTAVDKYGNESLYSQYQTIQLFTLPQRPNNNFSVIKGSVYGNYVVSFSNNPSILPPDSTSFYTLYVGPFQASGSAAFTVPTNYRQYNISNPSVPTTITVPNTDLTLSTAAGNHVYAAFYATANDQFGNVSPYSIGINAIQLYSTLAVPTGLTNIQSFTTPSTFVITFNKNTEDVFDHYNIYVSPPQLTKNDNMGFTAGTWNSNSIPWTWGNSTWYPSGAGTVVSTKLNKNVLVHVDLTNTQQRFVYYTVTAVDVFGNETSNFLPLGVVQVIGQYGSGNQLVDVALGNALAINSPQLWTDTLDSGSLGSGVNFQLFTPGQDITLIPGSIDVTPPNSISALEFFAGALSPTPPSSSGQWESATQLLLAPNCNYVLSAFVMLNNTSSGIQVPDGSVHGVPSLYIQFTDVIGSRTITSLNTISGSYNVIPIDGTYWYRIWAAFTVANASPSNSYVSATVKVLANWSTSSPWDFYFAGAMLQTGDFPSPSYQDAVTISARPLSAGNSRVGGHAVQAYDSSGNLLSSIDLIGSNAGAIRTNKYLAAGSSGSAISDPGNAGTIHTNSNPSVLYNPGGARTGMILEAGTYDGQLFYLLNQSANTIQFNATDATAHLLDSTNITVAAKRKATFQWNSSLGLWVYG